MSADLIERLEAAQSGDRHLDYAIKGWLEAFDDYWALRVAADWTTSLDAALALAERVFPKPAKAINGNAQSGYVAFLMWRDGRREGSQQVFPTPALSLCAAVLRARQANEAGR